MLSILEIYFGIEISQPQVLLAVEQSWKLALEITWSGENKLKMKCFCPQAWPCPPQMLPEREQTTLIL